MKRTALEQYLRQAALKEMAAAHAPEQAPEAFKDFKALELYCPKCKRAMAVKESMLLVLPNGDLFDYSCVSCGTSLGTRTG